MRSKRPPRMTLTMPSGAKLTTQTHVRYVIVGQHLDWKPKVVFYRNDLNDAREQLGYVARRPDTTAAIFDTITGEPVT